MTINITGTIEKVVPVCFLPEPCGCKVNVSGRFLDVEKEVHNVAVLDDIFLALRSELSGRSDGTFTA